MKKMSIKATAIAAIVLGAFIVQPGTQPAEAMKWRHLRQSTNVIDCRPDHSTALYRWWHDC